MNNTKLSIALLACLLLISVSSYEIDEGVLVLNSESFSFAIRQYPNLLVEFYTPGCEECEKLVPEYRKAAQKLIKKGSEIKFAKVDAEAEKELAAQYGVQEYPALKWFCEGEVTDYDGPKESAGLYDWVRSHIKPKMIEFVDSDEIQKVLDQNKTVVVYWGTPKDKGLYMILAELSTEFKDLVFLYSGEKEFKKLFNVKRTTSLSIFRHFMPDVKQKADFEGETGPVNLDTVRRFLSQAGQPLLIPLNEDWYNRIFELGCEEVFIYFYNEVDEDKEKQAKQAALHYHDKHKFISIDVTSEIGKKVTTDKFKLSKDRFPQVAIVKGQGLGEFEKFVMGSLVVATNIHNFYKKISQFTYPDKLKSAPEPEQLVVDNIYQLVGDNFVKKVIENHVDALVAVCDQTSKDCVRFKKQLAEFASAVKSIKNFIVGEIDGYKNEVPTQKFDKFPTVLFYQRGRKASPTRYKGSHNAGDIWDWVKNLLTVPFVREEISLEVSAEFVEQVKQQQEKEKEEELRKKEEKKGKADTNEMYGNEEPSTAEKDPSPDTGDL